MSLSERAEKIRVLIAGEQALLRSGLLLLVAEQADMEAGEAAGAAAARDEAPRFQPDVVVLDYDGAGGSAHSVVSALSGEGMRVIAMTASDEPEQMLAAIRAGARGAAPRSASSRTLLEAVRAVSNGLRWMTPDLERYCRHLGVTSAREEPAQEREDDDWDRLTAREREIATLVADGLKHKAIAERLGISVHTVKNHLRHIFVKLDVSNRVELAVYGRAVER